MRVIGLTGGIASGKTTIAEVLAKEGGVILDADLIARDVVEPGTPGLEAIVREFGPEVLTAEGRLDRPALARRVFGDQQARERLNAIVHPAVKTELRRELARLAHREPAPEFVVLVVPLLLETGMQALVDTVWLVAVPEAIQKERLMRRDGLDATAAEARIASQWPLERKAALSDRLIDNTGSPEDVRRRVREALAAEGLT